MGLPTRSGLAVSRGPAGVRHASSVFNSRRSIVPAPRGGRRMLKQKLSTTAAIVLAVVVAALCADYVSNTFILQTPASFTPLNTFAIALFVSLPVCYYLVSQRFDLQRIKEALAAAVAEGQARRED